MDGQAVTVMADFTVFQSDADCIRFRSRVLLQNSRYADNALIKEAIADRDSDKMAEGLKDAGYATSSEYVESLKSVMRTYNLYRFDGMGVDDFEKGAASGDAIVQAAYSQLGVPYVWGGSTPGVGLDCSVVDQNVQSAPAFFELGKNASDAVNIAQITAERQAISAEHLLRPRKVLRVGRVNGHASALLPEGPRDREADPFAGACDKYPLSA